MAIYSLNHRSVGKSTHAAGTSAAHVQYITRAGAMAYVDSHGMPRARMAAAQWLNAQEETSRKNERMIDKIMVALPLELSEKQQNDLVRAYLEKLTGNRCAWFFAIHRKGKDAANPHAHIVIRDRDLETNKRILDMSASKKDRKKKGLPEDAMHHIRVTWGDFANDALEAAGLAERIDHRSLEAQGVVDRQPQIHIGPKAQHVNDNVQVPKSQDRDVANVVYAQDKFRKVRYTEIDQGSRRAHNDSIIGMGFETRRHREQMAAQNHAQTQEYRAKRKKVWAARKAAEQAQLRAYEAELSRIEAEESYHAQKQQDFADMMQHYAEEELRLQRGEPAPHAAFLQTQNLDMPPEALLAAQKQQHVALHSAQETTATDTQSALASLKSWHKARMAKIKQWWQFIRPDEPVLERLPRLTSIWEQTVLTGPALQPSPV